MIYKLYTKSALSDAEITETGLSAKIRINVSLFDEFDELDEFEEFDELEEFEFVEFPVVPFD